jgi:hypothetical protein
VDAGDHVLAWPHFPEHLGPDSVSQLEPFEAHGSTHGEEIAEVIEALLNPHGGQGWFHRIASKQALLYQLLVRYANDCLVKRERKT